MVVMEKRECVEKKKKKNICFFFFFNMTTTEELQKFTGFIEELGKTAIDLKSQILTFKKRIEDGEWTTSQGISLLEVKYHILLEYITSLVGIIRLKLNGLSIENHPLIDNLIRNRVTLEKMKPIEQKLKYQIDKLVRASITNETTVNSLDGKFNHIDRCLFTYAL
jgi:U3 small nucleolar ribonucleoprotein protein LCP5